MALPSRVVNHSLDVPADVVYQFAHRMENLPKWASGLASGISQEKGHWFTESPMGKVKVEMAPENEFGVMDHEVTLPDGHTVHNAFRVTPAGDDASLLSFVVLRMPGTSDESFENDVATVTGDLKALEKALRH